jgi:hypothetical protein
VVSLIVEAKLVYTCPDTGEQGELDFFLRRAGDSVGSAEMSYSRTGRANYILHVSPCVCGGAHNLCLYSYED